MKLSIVVIGDELLLGRVTDTNSGFIARHFDTLGWEIASVETVGDTREAISSAIKRAMECSSLVITTGGLGPTKDDITKGVMTEIFGGEPVKNDDVLENIINVFNLRGLKMNPLTADQAIVPSSCRVIQNRLGTAPIMVFERDGRMLIAMPGVPFETEGMLVSAVIPEVIARFQPDTAIAHRTVIVTGITESALAKLLEEFEESLPAGFHLAYLPTPGFIRLRLDGVGKDASTVDSLIDSYAERLKETLGSLMLYDGDGTPAEIVLTYLRRHGLTMATAESCTGGNIAHKITEIAGCSDSYVGSVVSYSNGVKANLLGVSRDDLERYGAVSREVVEQMASGVCRATGADCSVATSGIAGPGGGTPDKPVGTVWTAVCVKGHVTSRLLKLPGNRSRVIERATNDVLIALAQTLRTL